MNNVDWNAVRLVFDVFQVGVMLLFALYVKHINKHRATSKAIENVNKRIDEVDRHVSSLEHKVGNQPGHGDIDHLRTEIQQTNRNLAELAAQLTSTTALLNRLHEYLLQERNR